MEKFMNYIFIVLIASFFTSITFYAAHVFFPIEENNCWQKYNEVVSIDKNYNDPIVQKQDQARQDEINKCDNLYQQTKKENDMYKLIIIGSINVLVLILLIFIFGLNTIGLGLFAGILLSSIIASISYYDSSSKIALAIIIVEFILCMIILNKEIKNSSLNNKSKKENKKK